jgi:hypothetical protein
MQALSWLRMKIGRSNYGDSIWFKHEFVERFFDSKDNLGYFNAHNKAQKFYNGQPWTEANNYCETLLQSFADPFNNYADPSQNQF